MGYSSLGCSIAEQGIQFLPHSKQRFNCRNQSDNIGKGNINTDPYNNKKNLNALCLGNNQFVHIGIWGRSSKGVNPEVHYCGGTQIFILNFTPVEAAEFQTMRKLTAKLGKQFSLRNRFFTESQ